MKKSCIVVLAAIILINIFSFPAVSKACSCEQPPGVEEEVSRSKAVFTGTVLNVRETTPFFGAPTKTVLFEVEETWKGVEQSQIIVGTGSGGGDCGSYFQEETSYLVYAREPSMYGGFHEFESLVCSRTSEVAAAQEDMAVLGAGNRPTEDVDLANRQNGHFMWIPVFLATGIVIFVVFLKKKKRGNPSL